MLQSSHGSLGQFVRTRPRHRAQARDRPPERAKKLVSLRGPGKMLLRPCRGRARARAPSLDPGAARRNSLRLRDAHEREPGWAPVRNGGRGPHAFPIERHSPGMVTFRPPPTASVRDTRVRAARDCLHPRNASSGVLHHTDGPRFDLAAGNRRPWFHQRELRRQGQPESDEKDGAGAHEAEFC